MNSGIYSIVNTVNNKQYIGSTNNFIIRKRDHFALLKNNKHFNNHLQNSYNKHSRSIFEFRIIEECSIDKLIERENYYIYLLKAMDSKYGYNLQDATRNNLSSESRIKIGNGNRGKRFTEDHKRKLSESKKGNKNYNFGRRYTKEEKEKFSKSHIGQKAWNKGISNIKCCKKIKQFDLNNVLIKEFPSIKDAQKYIGITYQSTIGECCNGKRKTAHGYKWSYA